MDPAEVTRGLHQRVRGLRSLRAGELGVNCPGVDKLLNILEDDPVAQGEDVQTRILKGVRQELRSTCLVQCGLRLGAVSAHFSQRGCKPWEALSHVLCNLQRYKVRRYWRQAPQLAQRYARRSQLLAYVVIFST